MFVRSVDDSDGDSTNGVPLCEGDFMIDAGRLEGGGGGALVPVMFQI